MKIAILSDIHGNLPALETVAEHISRWQADHIVVNGDIVNRGPKSVDCWRFIQRQNGWAILRGNHEEYVLGHLEPKTRRDGLNAPSYWVFQQFAGAVAPFQTLPNVAHFNKEHCHTGRTNGGVGWSDVVVTHASLNGNRDGIYPSRAAAQVEQQISLCPTLAGTKPTVFVTSHTHIPGIYEIGKTLLVNTGSVGQPCDGDLRASYAQLAWHRGVWQATIVRLVYDREQTRRDFADSGFLEKAGLAAPLIYHEWRTGKDVVVSWMKRYWAAVSAGKIAWETAVSEHLKQFK